MEASVPCSRTDISSNLFSFQLLKISIRPSNCKATLWTVEKRYTEERAYFKDWMYSRRSAHQHKRYI
ncbi:hypothetical protein ElyMa_000470900, partial [Elysia marginata]